MTAPLWDLQTVLAHQTPGLILSLMEAINS